MRIQRWVRPVTVALRGPAAAAHAGFLRSLLAELGGLTGLSLALSTDGASRPAAGSGSGTIDIELLDRPDAWPPPFRPGPGDAGPFVCGALPLALRGVLRRSRIFINAAFLPPPVVDACLVEEVVQSLGLLGEVDDDRETLLSDQVGFRELTATDRLLLRVLYDPRLAPGMASIEALRLLPAILRDKLATQAEERAVPSSPPPPPPVGVLPVPLPPS